MIEGDSKLFYTAGYKYRLEKNFRIKTKILGYSISTDWISLDTEGWLELRKGYAWDGASGPTIDSPSSMRGSAAHDAIYQLMRLGLLPTSYRVTADELFENLCITDGMLKIRAVLWERCVRWFAGGAAMQKSERKVYSAP